MRYTIYTSPTHPNYRIFLSIWIYYCKVPDLWTIPKQLHTHLKLHSWLYVNIFVYSYINPEWGDADLVLFNFKFCPWALLTWLTTPCLALPLYSLSSFVIYPPGLLTLSFCKTMFYHMWRPCRPIIGKSNNQNIFSGPHCRFFLFELNTEYLCYYPKHMLQTYLGTTMFEQTVTFFNLHYQIIYLSCPQKDLFL